MKCLGKSVLIALILVLSASAGDFASKSDFGDYKKIKVKDLNINDFKYVYTFECKKADMFRGFKESVENGEANLYQNGMLTIYYNYRGPAFKQYFLLFKDKNKCKAFEKQKNKFKNVFTTALNYKLKHTKYATCQKVNDSEALLKKIDKKYKNDLIVKFNSPIITTLEITAFGEEATYSFFHTLGHCKYYKEVILKQ